MSHIKNSEYIENKAQMFDEAVERGDYQTALAIARDFKAEGFGTGLIELLRSMPLHKFAITSPIQL